jgi:hypothetical protein
MLGKVTGKVANASSPVHEELALVDAVTYPVKSHVNCSEAPLCYSFIGNSSGASVVCLDWYGTLWVKHVDQCRPKWHTVAGIVK